MQQADPPPPSEAEARRGVWAPPRAPPRELRRSYCHGPASVYAPPQRNASKDAANEPLAKRGRKKSVLLSNIRTHADALRRRAYARRGRAETAAKPQVNGSERPNTRCVRVRACACVRVCVRACATAPLLQHGSVVDFPEQRRRLRQAAPPQIYSDSPVGVREL